MLFNDPQCPVRIEEKCPPAVNIMPLDFELKSMGTFQFFSRLKGAYFHLLPMQRQYQGKTKYI